MKKIIAVIICTFLVLGAFASCSASSNEKFKYVASDIGYDMANEKSAGFAEENGYTNSETAQSKSDSAMGADKLSEKLVKTVDMSIETKEFTACIASLKASATANGGYIEKSDVDSNGYYNYNENRYASITFRIPADKLDAFLLGTEEKGKVTSKTENVENVTMEYVDTESRIKACEAERDSLLEILKKATTVADIISVRQRLTEVNYEIESYTARLRVLENRVSYSTVSVSIREVQRVAEEETTLGSEIKNRFLETWDSLVEFIRSFVVWLIGGIPVLVPLIIFTVIAIIIIRKKIKKRRAKKLAAMNKE